MNVPPKAGIRVPADEMRAFVTALFEKAGTTGEDAALMATLLVQTDLRGIFSHGSAQAPGYLRMMLDGRVNPRPEIRIISETSTTQVLDGDGGMGHFPSCQGTRWAIARAKEHGLAAVTTRNHFHFGGASKYTRMALAHDCIGFALSSHRYALDPEDTILHASGGSPISIAIPTGEQPPLVLDMGAQYLPLEPKIFEKYPWVYFKNLGLGAVLQAWGGIFAGIYQPEFQAPLSQWESNQGAFIAVVNVSNFIPVDELKKEMDRYVGEARKMKSLPGYDRAELAGGVEWQSEIDYTRNGVPISLPNQEALQSIAGELKVVPPFAKYEHTRFGN